jgi:type IV secretory pathway VirB4 component
MTYQIPQQLTYKEKIMFGLTFKQLVYALIFGVVALALFKIISYTPIATVLAFLTSLIGVCFMFFDMDMILRDYYYYFRFRKITLMKKDIYSFFGVTDIKEDCIINVKGKKIAVIKVTPINFSIKLLEEKESIMLAFQKFLNSLDFPTQIIMNTKSLDLQDYLKSLEVRATKQEYFSILEDYKKFLMHKIHDNKIMNRIFYIVIPEQTNIDIQVNVCIERFHALNLKVERVKTRELVELFTNFFPETKEGVSSTMQEKKADIIINNNITYLDVNKRYTRIIYASGYPRMVEPGFLDKIVSLLGDFNLSLHIQPYPIETMLVDLNKELQKQRADLYAMETKGIINPSLEIQYADTRHTLETLQKGQERLFNISLYITCKADSVADLDLLTKKVEAELNSIMIQPRTATFRMLQGLRSVAPLGVDELQAQRNITTSPLATFFPFTSQFLQADNMGVWLGLNKNNIPIIKDIFKLSNPNGVVLAQSGGGKSYFCKLLITRYLLNGTKVMIIDPQGEYTSLVERFKGQIIDLSRVSQTLINPFDLMGHDYTEKRLSLMDLMPVMLGDLSEPQKAFLDKALTEMYKSKGITLDPDTWHRNPPILGDLLEALTKLTRKATQIERATVRSVINRLEMYVSGVFSFLNRETNIGFNSNLVCFNLGNMPKQIKPVIMFLVLDYVYMKMKSDLNRKILLVDEAWSLLSRTEDAGYILEIVKTCRKFNLGLLLINQEVEDLFNSRAGKSVLANSAYTMLLRQKPSVIKNICEAFHLSPAEREHLLTASVGEGLLIMEDEHSQIKVVASPEEHKIITTNADEILTQKEIKPHNKKANVTVDLDKRLYRKKELNREEATYLLSQGYVAFSQKSLASGKKEDFLLKKRHNESLNHMFTVYNIAEYLEKRGIKVSMYATQMPDLVFNLHGKPYAIEVETGSVMTNMKKFEEKVTSLKKNYGTNWSFVVTNRNFISKYRSYGKTMDLRGIRNSLNKLVKKV